MATERRYRNHRGQVLVVLPAPISGYMTWVEHPDHYDGYGFHAPTREAAQQLLNEAAKEHGWGVVDDV